MPRIDDIDKFKQRLNSLSNESAMLEEIGEVIEDVPPPESAIDEDLNELLGTAFSPDEDSRLDEPSDDTDSSSGFDSAFAFDQSDESAAGPAESEDLSADADDQDLQALFGTDAAAGEPDQFADSAPAEELPSDSFDIPEDLSMDGLPNDLGELDESAQTDEPEMSDGDIFPGPEEDAGSLDLDDLMGDGSAQDNFSLPEDQGAEDAGAGLDLDDLLSGSTEPESDSPESEDFPAEAEPDEFFSDDVNALSEGLIEDAEGDHDPFSDFNAEDFGVNGEEMPPETAGGMDDTDAIAELSNTDDIFPDISGMESSTDIPDEIPGADEGPADFGQDFAAPEGQAADQPVEMGLEPPEDFPEMDELNLFDDTAGASGEALGSLDDLGEAIQADTETADFDSAADFPDSFDESADSLDEYDDVDSFDLGDLDEGFGFEAEEPRLDVEEDQPSLKAEEPAGAVISQISDKDFQKLQHTLNLQPRNLKIAIEELIGSSDFGGDQLQNLLKALISGKTTKELAAIISRITGKKIKIPAQYEKMTAEQFFAKKGTFAYTLRYNILPMFLQVMAVILVMGMLGVLGYGYVYQPIKASGIYKTGLEEIANGRYISGNEYFRDAYEVWPSKKQFFNYAEAFIEQKQYGLAEEKYVERLIPPLVFHHDKLVEAITRRKDLSGMYGYEYNRNAHYDYAAMESEYLANYELAETQFRYILGRDMRDREAKLAYGDNYMRWARDDGEMYEKARRQYAEYRQFFGDTYEVSFRYLRYFIETDRLEDVIKFRDTYQELRKNDRVDSQIYAEMAGYLMDRNIYDGISDVLDRSEEEDEYVPEVHYQQARYYRHMNKKVDEGIELKNTLAYLGYRPRLTDRELAIQIDTYNRIGENLYRNGQSLAAQVEFESAEELYTASLSTKAVRPEAKFGKIYSNLGDIHYYNHLDYDMALLNYNRAEKNLYKNRAMDYKQGYIYFAKENYNIALGEFYQAEDSYEKNNNLLYALGNTFFLKNSNNAAMGYYLELRDRLEEELASQPYLLENPYLLVNERSDYQSLVRSLAKVYNNLGVSYYTKFLETGDAGKKSEALYNFTRSQEYSDFLTRDPESLERGAPYNNIAVLNSDILFRIEEGGLYIDKKLVKDLFGYVIQ